MHRSIRWAGVLLALLVLTGACGEGKKIGDPSSPVVTGKDGEECESGAIGGCTTTTVKPVATTTAAAAAAQTTTTAKKAVVTTTTAAAAPSAEIYINDDTAGKSIEPDKIVGVGSIVRFVNRHPSPRAVHGTRNEFTSPVIQPGSHWDYKANLVGRIEIEEICQNPEWKCRPYAKGYLTVQGR